MPDRDFHAAGNAARAAARAALTKRWGDQLPISDGDLHAIIDAALEAALPHLGDPIGEPQ